LGSINRGNQVKFMKNKNWAGSCLSTSVVTPGRKDSAWAHLANHPLRILPWLGLVVTLAAAVVSGVIVGLIARSAGRNQRGEPVPFGPFLAIGALVGLFFGPQLFGIYVRFAGLA